VQISKRAILYGPTGCGKSLLIMALADQMGISVFSVKVTKANLHTVKLGKKWENLSKGKTIRIKEKYSQGAKEI
jgi:SpoVK/Ycf46/Vps4 family AAA+-type ATPase